MTARKRGRPVSTADPKQIRSLAAIGCTQSEIGRIVGCDEKTIRARFHAEWEDGHAEMKESIRRMQLKAAKNGNVAMLIWLGKQYLGQRDRIDETRREEVVTIERIAPKIGLADTA